MDGLDQRVGATGHELMHVAVFETGGTINGILAPDAPPPQSSRVIAWLNAQAIEAGLRLDRHVVCMKDSRAVQDSDRDNLVSAVEQCRADAVIIPHGTFTMPETGRYLASRLSANALSRPIILLGSLVPLGDPDSDAESVLRFVLKALPDCSPGVQITMGERFWDPADVVKDAESGVFVATA